MICEPINLRPSAVKRWTTCTAAQAHINAHGLDKFSGSISAAEGVIAAKWAERYLKGEVTEIPDTVVEDHDRFKNVEVDLTPLKRVYIPECERLRAASIRFEVELPVRRFYAPSTTPGYADAAGWGRDGVVRVLDLKYGKGKIVNAEYNLQLFVYAEHLIQQAEEAGMGSPGLELGICQPRAGSYGTTWWEVSPEARAEMRDTINAGWVANQYPALRRFAPSNEACLFCPAKSVSHDSPAYCPGLSHAAHSTVSTLALPGGTDVRDLQVLDTPVLHFLAYNADAVEAAIKVARSTVYSSLVTAGEESPFSRDFFIAKGRKGKRSWSPGTDLVVFAEAGPPKVPSPAQLEASLKQGLIEDPDRIAAAEALLKSAVTQSPAGPTLRRVCDGGKPYEGLLTHHEVDVNDI